MTQLAFTQEDRLFDGACVRFEGRDHGRTVRCGVTIYALKHHQPDLPSEGLLPGELFLEAYDRLAAEIHHVARRKYEAGDFETCGPVEVMVHDHDFI